MRLDGQRFVIEMTPVWGHPDSDRGVISEGPVGLASLGHSKFFRYEVHCWRDGVIPDLAAAVASPIGLTTTNDGTRELIELLSEFPAATWGRDEQRAGEMWNSNSLTSWLLGRSGHDVSAVQLPRGGRAPGWSAGLVVAARR